MHIIQCYREYKVPTVMFYIITIGNHIFLDNIIVIITLYGSQSTWYETYLIMYAMFHHLAKRYISRLQHKNSLKVYNFVATSAYLLVNRASRINNFLNGRKGESML